MGVLSYLAVESTMLVVVFLGTVATGLVLWPMSRIISSVGSRRQTDSRLDDGVQVLCPCIFGYYFSAWQLTMRCTVLSVCCFFLFCLFGTVYRLLYFAVCDDCTVRAVVWNIQGLFLTLGFALMFVTHFERLRLTFSGSKFSTPKWAPKVLYGALLLAVLLLVGSFTLFATEPILAMTCVILFTFEYIAVSGYLIYAFWKKTMALLSSSQRDNDLMDAAVRVTVVVNVSLLTTVFDGLLWAVIFAVCPSCRFWKLMGGVMLVFDMCLSAFCLLCTFSRADDYYKRSFGKLHRWVLGGTLKFKDARALSVSVVTVSQKSPVKTPLATPS